uniref:Uncharacterized protein n=1 Tax=Opuntia streptacantha TaxID=393608 RepID=A0A7C9F839_OPUST
MSNPTKLACIECMITNAWKKLQIHPKARPFFPSIRVNEELIQFHMQCPSNVRFKSNFVRREISKTRALQSVSYSDRSCTEACWNLRNIFIVFRTCLCWTTC